MPKDWKHNPKGGYSYAQEGGQAYVRINGVEMTWEQYRLGGRNLAVPQDQPQPSNVPRSVANNQVGPSVRGAPHYGYQAGSALHRRRSSGAKRGNASVSSFNPLAPDYTQRPQKFFHRHKVFHIYWHENAGYDNAASQAGVSQDRKYGERIYSKHRRLAVVAVFSRHCICVSIQTYKEQGVSKPGVEPAHHAIVFTQRDPGPSELEISRGLDDYMRGSIRINPDNPQNMLDPLSRINYSELYTVQFNAKVKPLGVIHPHYVREFEQSLRVVLASRMFPPVADADDDEEDEDEDDDADEGADDDDDDDADEAVFE